MAGSSNGWVDASGYVHVPALDSRPIYDGSFLSRTTCPPVGASADDWRAYLGGLGALTDAQGCTTEYNLGLGDSTYNVDAARAPIVLTALQQIAAAVGKPGFNWLPYVNLAYMDNIIAWSAGGGNRVYYSGWISPAEIVNSILAEAAKDDPKWALVMYAPGDVQSATLAYQNAKQAASTGGGVLSQIISGVKNVAEALALPGAILALPALVGQPTIFQAIAANVQGAGASTFTDVNAATGSEAYGAAPPQVATATPVSASADITSSALPATDSTAASAGSVATEGAFTDANAATGAEAFGSSTGGAAAAGEGGVSLSTVASAGSAITKAVGAAIGTIFGKKSPTLTATGQPAQTNLMPLAIAGLLLLAVIPGKKRGRR